jgi:hypothetical protein
MKASELRIGNLINSNGYCSYVYSIESAMPLQDKRYSDKVLITLFNGGLSTIPIDECEPIHLTEEWLLKFGFNYDSDIALYSKSGYDVCINDDNSISYYLGEYGSWCKNITHVHQLQNLYFALTGEELIINETCK